MRNIVRNVGVVSALVALAVGAAPGMASADPDQCEGGEICLWENTNFNGAGSYSNPLNGNVRQWTGNDTNYNDNTWWDSSSDSWTSDGLDNETSAEFNNGIYCSVRVYQHTNYGGSYSTMFLGTSYSNLYSTPPYDNSQSSHKWCP